MKGCYLVTIYDEEIFVYATENELIEISTLDSDSFAKFPKDENVIDAKRCVNFNKNKRITEYNNIKFLFDAPEFEDIFEAQTNEEKLQMQIAIAQHCRWNQNQSRTEMFTECINVILDFFNNSNKYPGYNDKFRMPTPEDIEIMKKKMSDNK